MEFSKDHFHGLCCSHYIYIASWNFEDFCSVLNLLISHLTWIASSNEVTALDKTNLMNSVTNNSTNSAFHICYFSSFLCVYNKSNNKGKLWKWAKIYQGLTCHKNKYCHFVASHKYREAKFM